MSIVASRDPAAQATDAISTTGVASVIVDGRAAATVRSECGSQDLSSELDAICRSAARHLKVPLAFVTMIDDAVVRLTGRWGIEPVELPRAQTLCDHTMRLPAGEILIVPDLSRDARFADYDLVVQGPRLRFYAGIALTLESGVRVGTFCVADRVPRPDFASLGIADFRLFARGVEAQLRLTKAQLVGGTLEWDRRRVDMLSKMTDFALRATDSAHGMAEAAAGFGVWRIDVSAMEIAWSRGLAGIFGRPVPAGVLGLDEHLGCFHHDDRALVRRRIRDAVGGRRARTDGRYGGRARIVRPDGEQRNVVCQGMVERDVDGRVVALSGITLDVTDLNRSELAAEGANAALRATLESMDQGLVLTDADGRVRVSNERARRLLKIPERMLRSGADYGDIPHHLLANGAREHPIDNAARGPDIGLSGRGGLTRSDWQLADGTIVEMRTNPLADGSATRTYTDATQSRRDERVLRDSEERFRLLAENVTDVVVLYDPDLVRRYVSPSVEVLLGYEPQELVGRGLLDLIHPEEVASFREPLDDIRSGRVETVRGTQRYGRKDGTYVWVEVSIGRLRGDPGAPIAGFVGSLRDVSERKRDEEELRIGEERLAAALEGGSDGVWDLDIVTGAFRLSGQWLSILGFVEGEIAAHISVWEPRTHPEDLPRAKILLANHLKGATPRFECEYRIRTKAGDFIWTLARGKVVARDANGRALRMVGIHVDVTRRKEAEAIVAHMAAHDALTGLPNRARFQRCLDEEIANIEGEGGSFALLACDLDRFKAVNDTLGHHAGDALLRIVAARLRAVVDAEDTVARLGGDEFAIILRRLDRGRNAGAIAARVIAAMSDPIVVENRSVVIGVSVGIAEGISADTGAERAFRNADIALYRAKAVGRNTYRHYDPKMDDVIAQRVALEHDLRETVERRGFTLYYQPIVDLRTEVVCGFEALLRWQHPTMGAISPAEFIPLAEETGMIVSLGEWVLHEACCQAATWPDRLRIAVNVSAVQFQQPDVLLAHVTAALASSGMSPERLELEITESVLMHDAEAVLACLHHLRDSGVRIALDDFGTGYSSLAYLRRFPFSKIKIDRAFVREIADPDTAAIVRAVVGLGARVGADITAEGVETEEQLQRVRHAGCTQLQGFLFSRPLASGHATAMAHGSRRLGSDEGAGEQAIHGDGADGRANGPGRPSGACRVVTDVVIVEDDLAVSNGYAIIVEGAGYASTQVFQVEDLEAAPIHDETTVILDISLEEWDAVDVIQVLADRGFKGAVQLASGATSDVLEEVKRLGLSRGLRMLPVLRKPILPDRLLSALANEAMALGVEPASAEPAAASTPATERVDLWQALQSGWVEVWYQPKYDVATREMVGAECLSRVRHPQWGIVPPSAFLPYASSAAMAALSEKVIRQACADWPEFEAAGRSLRLAINIPGHQIVELPLVKMLRQLPPRSERWPGLVLEITEEEALRDLDTARAISTQLRIYGVTLSIDDFGTGYSSFARLREIPFKEIKLDRSLVDGCADDEVKRSLCKSVVDLAHSFGAKAVAEGIERQEDLRYLRAIRCDLAQGYLLARPMPKAELLTNLARSATAQAVEERATVGGVTA